MQEADYSKRFTPNRVDPIRFHGPVYILVGPYSFSATIQFVVAAQDFGIAKIAGEETAALSCQTGKYEQINLPRTGLAAFTPVIAYTRPSGRGCGRGVVPDLPITTNEVEPEKTLSSLVSRVKADFESRPTGTRKSVQAAENSIAMRWRKNWLFAGSDDGGGRAAAIYTLLGAAKLNNMDPEAYLRHALAHIAPKPRNPGLVLYLDQRVRTGLRRLSITHILLRSGMSRIKASLSQ